jgi:hypothetical protein
MDHRLRPLIRGDSFIAGLVQSRFDILAIRFVQGIS